MEPPSLPIIRAKVVRDRLHGELKEIRRGTKHFRSGAKVFVVDAYPGAGRTVTVVGHHRAGGQFAEIDMPVRHLEGFVLERTYSPTIIKLIEARYQHPRSYTEAYVSELLTVLPAWATES